MKREVERIENKNNCYGGRTEQIKKFLNKIQPALFPP